MFQCARYVGSQGKRDVIVKKRRRDFKSSWICFCIMSAIYFLLRFVFDDGGSTAPVNKQARKNDI